jgi:predicted DNA-binding ribbon-helix-helix protein
LKGDERLAKDKDFSLYLDNESYEKLKEWASELDMTIQDYVYHRLFFFFLNQQKLPKFSYLKGGNRYVHLRVPDAVYMKIKNLARERKIKLSEVIRRIVSGTDFVPESGLKKVEGGIENDK